MKAVPLLIIIVALVAASPGEAGLWSMLVTRALAFTGRASPESRPAIQQLDPSSDESHNPNRNGLQAEFGSSNDTKPGPLSFLAQLIRAATENDNEPPLPAIDGMQSVTASSHPIVTDTRPSELYKQRYIAEPEMFPLPQVADLGTQQSDPVGVLDVPRGWYSAARQKTYKPYPLSHPTSSQTVTSYVDRQQTSAGSTAEAYEAHNGIIPIGESYYRFHPVDAANISVEQGSTNDYAVTTQIPTKQTIENRPVTTDKGRDITVAHHFESEDENRDDCSVTEDGPSTSHTSTPLPVLSSAEIWAQDSKTLPSVIILADDGLEYGIDYN